MDGSGVSPKPNSVQAPWPARFCAGPMATDEVNYKTTKQGREYGGGRERGKNKQTQKPNPKALHSKICLHPRISK